ncbi:MAG: membrane protein insertase YidC [Sphingobacterium sp.]
MDRNNILGFVLIFAILAGSFYLMKPSEGEIKKEQQLQDSLKQVREGITPVKDTITPEQPVASQPDSATMSEPFGPVSFGDEQTYTLENELIKVQVSTKGGQVKAVELKNETNFDGGPLVLFDGESNNFGLEFNVPGKAVNTSKLFFEAQGESFSVTGEESKSLTMRLTYDDGRYIDYIYTLAGNGYNLQFDIQTVGIGSLVDVSSKKLLLNWQTTLLKKERNVKSEREKSTIFFKEAEGGVDHLSESSDDSETVEEKLSWIAFKQHFFSAVLTSNEGFNNTDLAVTYLTQDSVVKDYRVTSELAFNKGDDAEYGFSFFFGPNQYKTLKAEGDDFAKIINMGWGPMGWINIWITVPIFDFLDGFSLNYGIVILILTLFLKLLMFPLTYKSYQSMGKMRVLKPQLDELKAKVGDDNPMLLQQEQMKLYKQAGVNPLGGCLPLVLQMPFTLAFFFFFPNLFELRGETFLWVKDLSTFDAPITFAPIFGIGHISFMCILMTLTTILTTWYNNSTSGAVNNQMKYIGYFMPLIFFFVLNSFPAGLNYYYFLSAVMTFLTQVLIRQFVNDDKILAKIEAHKNKPQSEKKSSFQKKMEDMMRQQQADQKKNKK